MQDWYPHEFVQLLSPTGQKAIATAQELKPSEQTLLRCLKNLQKTYPRELARSALDTVLLRSKAKSQRKFSRSGKMYFTREGLEQATNEMISGYRAKRFSAYEKVGDFGCGIGGDTLGLAKMTSVLAIDQDLLRLAMARENLKAYGVDEQADFCPGDFTKDPLPSIPAAFFDPARRSQGKRYLSIESYQPPLSILPTWQQSIPGIGVKIAPGVAWEEIETMDAEVEFISLFGELKECVLWFGPLKTTNRRATVLPGEHTLESDFPFPDSEVSPPGRYLYEPDPSILRSGLVTFLGQKIEAKQLDQDIAYLTADNKVCTPFAKRYLVEEAFPFHSKTLREVLRQRNVGRVIIKRRGSPVDPVQLTRQLGLSGPESRVVFLTRFRGEPFVLIAFGQELDSSPDQ